VQVVPPKIGVFVPFVEMFCAGMEFAPHDGSARHEHIVPLGVAVQFCALAV
jgi:hypothetical protein